MFCRLAVLMKEKDPRLTQRQLAQVTGLAVSTIGRLHNNDFERVDRMTIETLCHYLGCGISDLFEMREVKERES